ncbi:MAG: TetR/AcrR family transcriptional regulator [Clostridium sp.]|uniref:TetR/AcrR family transcriptional regulator n=1 Tax=Clostridium sp. TaxID=1506 RepID=UPI003EE60390
MESISNKKAEILSASRILFSEKGFRDTSVQDIAKYCKMSKATIYKLFNSKEELLISIINKINVEVFEEIENIRCGKEKNNISKLERKIEIFLSSWNKKREFVNMIYENQTLMKDLKVKELIIQNKKVVLNWYKKILLEAFDGRIENKLDEILIVLSGTVKELKSVELIYVENEIYITDFKKTAKFLTSIIVALVDERDNIEEFLEFDKIISPLEEVKIKKEVFLKEWNKKKEKLFLKLKNEKNELDRKNIIDSVEELTLEIQKDDWREFLVESQILYLERYDIVKEEIKFFKEFYNQL